MAPPSVELAVHPLEQAVEWSHRWRGILGFTLAAVITLGAVLAYQRTTAGSSDLAHSNSGDGDSSLAAVTDFDDTAAATSSTATGRQEVSSEVDGADPTLDPAGPSTTVTTVAPTTTPSTLEPSPTEAPTTTDTTDQPVATSETTADAVPSSETSSPSTTTEEGEPSTTLDPATSSTSDTTSSSSTSTTAATGPVRVEAESGTPLGTARIRNDHLGFSGTGFVGDLINEGAGVTLEVAAAGGTTPLTIRYSAGDENGPASPRRISVLVNGVEETSARMRTTESWDAWDVVTGSIELAPGVNKITLQWVDADDTGWVNIDYLEIG